MGYYTEDIAVVPFRLLCHAISPTMPRPAAWIVAALIRIAGKFGLRLPPTHGVGFVGSETQVEPSELPPPAIALWAPILEQLRDLGFQPLKCEIAATVGTKLLCSTVLLDSPGETLAILEWTRMPTANGMEENTPLELNSYCDGQPDIVTGVVRKIDVPMSEMLKIDSVEMISLANNRPLAERYAAHQQRCVGKKVLRLTEESALRVVRERGKLRLQEVMDWGFVRELKPAEIERLRGVDLTELNKF
ncbi:MAG: hypothetical protein ACR2NM_05270 [Bythopirellula sp.]